ncbi:MAG: hypothetical protein ACJASG_002215, partial [Oleiphilaceae bacterium]
VTWARECYVGARMLRGRAKRILSKKYVKRVRKFVTYLHEQEFIGAKISHNDSVSPVVFAFYTLFARARPSPSNN